MDTSMTPSTPRATQPFDLLDLSLLLLIAPLHPLCLAFVVTQWFARRSTAVAESMLDLLDQVGLPRLSDYRLTRALLPGLAQPAPRSLPLPADALSLQAAVLPHPAPQASPPAVLTQPPAPALPALLDLSALLSTGFRPNANQILLGLGPGGVLHTAPITDLCHVALCGTTGAGKSNLHRLLLAQILARGARVWLADPHYTPLDVETGEDWRPIVQRLDRAPARKPAEIRHMLETLTHELGVRLERRSRSEYVGPLLFFAFDELPVILDSVTGAEKMVRDILRQGRKVKLLTIGASQDFLAKTLGNSGTIRECYRTAYYVGGDLHSASVLCDMLRRDIPENQLGKGIALVRSITTTPAQLMRVPLVSNQALTLLLGSPAHADMPPTPLLVPYATDISSSMASSLTSRVTSHEPSLWLPGNAQSTTGSHAEDTQECASSASGSDTCNPEHERILALFREGKSVVEIISQVYNNASRGRRYQELRKQVEDIIREALHNA